MYVIFLTGDSKNKTALLVGLLSPVIILVIIAVGFLKMNSVRKERKLKEKEEDGNCTYEDTNLIKFVSE